MMVAGPVVAVLLAVKVSVLVPVVLVGLKLAVTPEGRPDADSATLLLKPFCAFTVMVLVPLLPCVIVKLAGEAESEKLGAGLTVKLTVVVWLKLPDVPVMVTVVGPPVVAVLLAVKVNVLEPVVLVGLKLAVTPDGKPEADKATLPLKPLVGFTVMVLVPLLP